MRRESKDREKARKKGCELCKNSQKKKTMTLHKVSETPELMESSSDTRQGLSK